jgi:hypothetical protein
VTRRRYSSPPPPEPWEGAALAYAARVAREREACARGDHGLRVVPASRRVYGPHGRPRETGECYCGACGIELRGCAWPDCGAFYDPLAVMEGRQEAPGWRRHSGFMLSMCAEHAVLAWGPDYSRHRATGSTGTACGCGGTLDPTGPTLGHLADAYVRHLVDSAA